MNNKTNNSNRRGAALLVVLIIVMAVTVLSFGYIARTDIELACGTNTLLRMQTDYLAESGLVHAKRLILEPQDVDTGGSGYWTGEDGQQLTSGDDYYDVSVARLGQLDYQIISTGYRQKNGETLGRSCLAAELRLDPCIVYWAGAATTIPAGITIDGDVYCTGNLTNNGVVNGDVFAGGTITGAFSGRKSELVSVPPVAWPGIGVSNFSSQYYIGYTSYSTQSIDPNVSGVCFSANGTNPTGIRYCSGDMELGGNVTINGALAVNGNLIVTGSNNAVTAVKNFPALLVSGEVLIKDAGTLEINGLAVITERLRVDPNAANFNVAVSGCLFIENGGIDVETTCAGSVNITAEPGKAALQTWPAPGSTARWRQAAGAFFKSIERN